MGNHLIDLIIDFAAAVIKLALRHARERVQGR